MSPEEYDELLDALDNEDIDTIALKFKENNIEPFTNLEDAPRIGHNNNELCTYLDYAISYSLNCVLDLFIDEFHLEIDDNIMANAINLQNIDTFKYLCSIGYIPQTECLCVAVRMCHSDIVDEILENDPDLIEYIDEDDIEYLFSFDMDEETIETIRVLFNNKINPSLFSKFLVHLKDPNSDYFTISDEEKDLAIEIIDFLENNNVT
jgi:hypothetical protein